MSKELVEHMANRFLAWKLPKDFYPDCGISFKPYPGMEPIGTNLLTYEQAKAMFEYVLEGQQQAQAEAVPQGWKLVPVEPTEAMLQEAARAWTPGVNHLEAHAIRYQAMLAAAPQPKGGE